ncbi:hypothetical protein [Govanella unica]|uniref:Uncharacterized protein n=1 Tax=Govanella unica TaxID=2975056 RepID=A0A9X3TWJ2_9PROT|nr:hypothetical protein [Govania unica]MDA5193295.1 hypothetical protein [Govania unica]
MALPVVGIISAIPWGKVIENAPMIVENARKLWSFVSRDSKTLQNPNPKAASITGEGSLEQRVAALEASNRGLLSEVAAMSDLILQLSEQNVSLVKRVEGNRKLLRAALVASLLSLAAVIYLLSHA